MDYMLSIMHSESPANIKSYSTYFENYDQKLSPVVVKIFLIKRMNKWKFLTPRTYISNRFKRHLATKLKWFVAEPSWMLEEIKC